MRRTSKKWIYPGRRESAVLVLALFCVCATVLSGCRARDFLKSPEGDESFFENYMESQAMAEGETAILADLGLDQITSLSYATGVLDSYIQRIEQTEDIETLMALFSQVTFTRLGDPKTEDAEAAADIQAQITPVMESGLILTYTVRTRDTVGSFYVSPEGQVCWFTSDGRAVFLSEPGAVDYMAIQTLCLSMRFGI